PADTVATPMEAAPAEVEVVAEPAATAATPLEADTGTVPGANAAVAEVGGARRVRRRWPWLALLLLVLAAVLGMALGVSVVLRGRSFGAQLPADQAARPTFIIAAPPSPSPSGSPRSPATPAAATTSVEEYTVEAGDTLRSIAQHV